MEKERDITKEELRKEWHKKFCLQGNNFEWLQFKDDINTWAVFDFFYAEIDIYKELFKQAEGKNKELDAKISHLESLVSEAKGIVRQYELGDSSQIDLCIKHFKELLNPLSGTIQITDENRETYRTTDTTN